MRMSELLWERGENRWGKGNGYGGEARVEFLNQSWRSWEVRSQRKEEEMLWRQRRGRQGRWGRDVAA